MASCSLYSRIHSLILYVDIFFINSRYFVIALFHVIISGEFTSIANTTNNPRVDENSWHLVFQGSDGTQYALHEQLGRFSFQVRDGIIITVFNYVLFESKKNIIKPCIV